MIPMWIRIGLFIWRLPREMERQPLDQFLGQLSTAVPRVREVTREASVRRIGRITRRWLRLRPFKRRNTCYTRSLVLFRFLDATGGDLRFHLGTEPSRTRGANIHGHAWVTLDGKALEPLPETITSRVSDLYTFPPIAGAGGSRPPALQGLAEHPPAEA